jgi:Mn-dependent DtxR family transcriptional regulator
MTEQKQGLTASNIKYLLILKKLSYEKNGVRCVDIASELGVTKPSVHAMMNSLKSVDLIHQCSYGVVALTIQGQKTAGQYERYYEALSKLLHSFFPKEADMKSAIYAILAELSENSLNKMCDNISSEMKFIPNFDK